MVAPWNHQGGHRRLGWTLETLRRRFPETGSVTLTTSTTTTTVTTAAMRAERMVILTPTDANAGAEVWHISDRSDGSFTITHANSGTTRTFDYIIL